jgi:hypothetical protein
MRIFCHKLVLTSLKDNEGQRDSCEDENYAQNQI